MSRLGPIHTLLLRPARPVLHPDLTNMKRKCLVFLTCVPILLLQASITCVAMEGTDINTDKTALLSLKAHITQDPANSLTESWDAAAPICNWVGVTCGVSHHRVTALDLPHMGLSGTIPPQIGNLRFLSQLSLRNNSFHGPLPDEFARLSRLKCLDLGFNYFTGNIPPFFVNLTMLKNLSLSRNKFHGSIPSSIGNCTLLKEIDFSENDLTGTIPPGIGELSNLEILRINENFLSGNFPSALFNISTMTAIVIHVNCLSGSLPSTIGLYLPNLVELQLGENQLDRTIPSSISNVSKLTLLDLHDNLFTGFIPALGNLRHLQVVDLANNHLTINLPAVPEQNFFSLLTNCKQLKEIKLSGNPLNATLPNSIGNLSASLEWFEANSCNFKGSIPREIGNLTNLIVLGLGGNDLIGTIPATIGRLRELQGLYLQGNKLQGTIESDLCNLESLVDLFLSGNKLFGSIPDCVGKLTSMRNLSLSSNNLTSTIPMTLWSLTDILAINLSLNFLDGSLPLQVQNLKVVTEINLSGNKLSGTITDSIGALPSLAYLSLAKNKFHGPIPQSFNGLISLEFLDLSCNNLSGVIPQDLETLLFLKYFNVSSNRLQGKIPDGGPFTNFSADSYLENSALCGAPHLRVPPCKAGVSSFLKKKKILLQLVLPIIASTLLAYSLFSWLKRQQKQVVEFKGTRYSYLEELRQATGGFTEGNIIGSGSSGTVYKGTLQDGMIVAIKVYNLEERSSGNFEVEHKVMHNTRHRNLVKILCSYNGSNFKALVMEYMAKGSLERWLYTYNYHLDIVQRLDIMIDVASAVKYLHHDCWKQIIHLDLNPSNIILDEDMVAHVSDFSIAKLIDAESVDVPSVVGTIGYIAPERGSNGAVSTRSDVYSFGIMLMETFTGKKPTDYIFAEEMSLRQWVMNSLPHEVNRVVDPFLLQEEEHFDAKMECLSSIMKLALCCSAVLPQERLNMKQIVNKLNSIKDALLMKM